MNSQGQNHQAPGPQFLSQRKCSIPDGPFHSERDAMPHPTLFVPLIHSASSDHLFQVSLELDLKANLGWKGISPTELPTHAAKEEEVSVAGFTL